MLTVNFVTDQGSELYFVSESITVGSFLSSHNIEVSANQAPAILLSGTRYRYVDLEHILSSTFRVDLCIKTYQNPLTVLLSSDEKKTVMIDERLTVQQLLPLIGTKMGLSTNVQPEFGLRVASSSTWLLSNLTLPEQGVPSTSPVLLRRRVFLQRTDPDLLKFHGVAWTEYNHRFLNGEMIPLCRDQVITLASLHLLSHIGKSAIKPVSLDLSQYVPIQFRRDQNIAQEIINARDVLELSVSEARFEFCKYLEDIEGYNNQKISTKNFDFILFLRDRFVYGPDEILYSNISRFTVDRTVYTVVVECKSTVIVIDSLFVDDIGFLISSYCKFVGNSTVAEISVQILIKDFVTQKNLAENLTQEVEQNRSKISEISSKLEEVCSENNSQKEQINELSKENQQLITQLEENTNTISENQTKLSSTEGQIVSLRQEISEKDAEIQQLRNKILELGGEFSTKLEAERSKQNQIKEKLGKLSWVNVAANFFEKNDGSVREIDRNFIRPVVGPDGKIIKSEINIDLE
ncbi:hypothetical protein RCL1_000821 [Eukaryota sp. TZLM3-RCL]